MRTSLNEGDMAQEPTKDLEEQIRQQGDLDFEEPSENIPEYVSTRDLEELIESDGNTEDVEDEPEETLYDQLPKGWDDIDWDGGEILLKDEQEVNSILNEYYMEEYKNALHRSEVERKRLQEELKEKQQYEEDFDGDDLYEEDEELDDFEEDEEDPKRLKKRVLILGSVGTALLLALLIGGFFLFNRTPTTIAEIQTKVNRLYTSEAKIDIKNSVSLDTLETYYLALKDISKEEKNSNAGVSVEQELDTIGYFISDNAMVDDFLDTKYDLASASLRENIEKIKANLSKYTVSGLSLTVKDKCTKIETELNEYEALKAELSAITDINVFVPSNYEARVNAITHEGNKKEVKLIYDKLVKDKEEAEAAKKAEELAMQEAQQATEAAVKKAEEEKARLQKELDQTKQQLQNQINKGKEYLQNVTGSGNNEEDLPEEGEDQGSGYYQYEEE